MMSKSADVAELLLSYTSVSIVASTGALTVPCQCAKRSELISELRQETVDITKLPLPLPIEDFRSWICCAHAVASSSERLDPAHVDRLLRAHKAAEFLRDDATREEVLESLATEAGHAVEDVAKGPESLRNHQWNRHQLMKIVDGLPQPAALDILAGTMQGSPRSSTQWVSRVHLLLGLLPRTHHPAIVSACCITEADAAEPLCEICTPASAYPSMTWGPSRMLNDVHDGDFGSADGVSRNLSATTAFQLLAAAAPLAGGSLELAWEPDRPSRPACSAAAASSYAWLFDDSDSDGGAKHPAAKRVCLEAPPPPESPGDEECVWEVARGGLKRVKLVFDVGGVGLLPARWCSALVQLVSLRHLHVELFVKSVESKSLEPNNNSQQQQRQQLSDFYCDFCMPEFTAALLCLPALEQVAVVFNDARRSCSSREDVSGHGTQLLDTLARMPQISNVTLKRCVNLHSRSMAPAERVVLSKLSRMSRLTSLELHMEQGGSDSQRPSDWGQIFGCALKQLPALAKLHLQFDVHGRSHRAHDAEAQELVQELFTAPGLPALSDFHLRLCKEGASAGEPLTLTQPLQQCMRSQHEALRGRMTALSFASRLTTPQQLLSGQDSSDAAALAGFVGGMTALQSLTLKNMDLGDGSLQALAGVLPGLACLTHLSITQICATPTGVLAVLTALLKPGGPGREGLRSLCIRSCCRLEEPEHAQHLASLLGQFRSLTHLDITRLKLGVEGLRVVVKGLGGLAQLRCVEARENVLYSNPKRDVVAEAGLDEAAATCIPAAKFSF